ncbi:hypothetical protein F5887DRAFT_935542, partial [Amanita rubescens]
MLVSRKPRKAILLVLQLQLVTFVSLPHHGSLHLSPAFPIMPTFRKLQRDEINKYGHLYFEYIKLCEDHRVILRQNPEESHPAYARISKEFKASFAGSRPASALSIDEIHSSLDRLAKRCKVEAQSIDDHVRIYFCSLGFIQLLLEHVVGDINVAPVVEVGTRLLREHILQRPLPTPLYVPAVTNIIPEKPILRKVMSSDIETWCSNPEELIGKRFTTSDECMRNAFLISDYCVKAVKGAQYDVLYQDREEEEVMGTDELLEELADCYLVL